MSHLINSFVATSNFTNQPLQSDGTIVKLKYVNVFQLKNMSFYQETSLSLK
jgi:hypothetical protein